MMEKYYENILGIKTSKKSSRMDNCVLYNRYEPTEYEALILLLKKYELKPNSTIVDFGCGLGRTLFFMHYNCGCKMVGVEVCDDYYKNAIANKESYCKKNKKGKDDIVIKKCSAEKYMISSKENVFYFFNPFSIKIFISVVNNIMNSFDKSEREIDLILYYPSDEYIYYLENNTSFTKVDNIFIQEKYLQNSREQFLVYRMSNNYMCKEIDIAEIYFHGEI